MKNIYVLLSLALSCAMVATPQGRPVDWPSSGGDARRTGWERSDIRITKDNIKDFQLILKRKLDGPQAGLRALTPPVVIGLLISYKGFKELGFVAGNSGDLWSIDLDTNREFWHRRFPMAKADGPCGAIATIPSLVPPAVFGGRRPAGAAAAPPGGARPPAAAANLPPRLGGGGFGGPRPLYFVAADGKLQQVSTSDGIDKFPPLDFLPAGVRPDGLLMTDNTVYAVSSNDCGGAPNALWALDLTKDDPKPAHFIIPAGKTGMPKFAVGNNGMVYLQSADTLHALSGKELQSKGDFTPEGKDGSTIATPTVFDYKGRDLIASAGKDGRLYLHDSQAFGSPLSQTGTVTAGSGHIGTGLSTWEDADGVRWVAAPVWGAVNADLKVTSVNGAAPNGSIVAFRLEEQNGKPVLVPAWVSRDLKSPVAPVITSGGVFALSTTGRAMLFAFDAASGKELWSSGNQVSAPGSLTGLTLANGRVFFTTTDNILFGFGIFLEI